MKICNYKLLGLAVLGTSLILSGCNLSSKPVNNIAVGSISCQRIADGIVALIKKVRTAEDGTLTIKNISNDLAVMTIEKQTATKLKSSGYAVQEILPKELRQKGDLDKTSISGTLTTINVQALDDSNQYQLTLIIGTQAYYRMLSKQNNQLVPVSGWVRNQNY